MRRCGVAKLAIAVQKLERGVFGAPGPPLGWRARRIVRPFKRCHHPSTNRIRACSHAHAFVLMRQVEVNPVGLVLN